MKISIILVRPRNPQNIGAAARAMANFGLSDLRIVAPYPPVWEEALTTAVHAGDIIKKAKVFETLPAALHDANFILATTALTNRKTTRQIISLPDIAKNLKNGNTAIVFGPEKTGLSGDEIALAHAVLNIPTTSKTPSINLAQAVVLCCYEISKNKIPARGGPPARAAQEKKPTFKEKQIVIQNIENLLNMLGLPPTLNQALRARRLQDIGAKDTLSKENIFFINAAVNKIISKINDAGH